MLPVELLCAPRQSSGGKGGYCFSMPIIQAPLTLVREQDMDSIYIRLLGRRINRSLSSLSRIGCERFNVELAIDEGKSVG